jgi:basic membrane protein A
VDVIFHAAGASGLGVFEAAEEQGKLVIGVDSNQNALKPGRVLSSMLKRVDQAVYNAIEQQRHGTFQAGTHYFGVKDKGVDFAVDENNRKLLEPYREKLEEVRAKIIRGEIIVPDYYTQHAVQ